MFAPFDERSLLQVLKKNREAAWLVFVLKTFLFFDLFFFAVVVSVAERQDIVVVVVVVAENNLRTHAEQKPQFF